MTHFFDAGCAALLEDEVIEFTLGNDALGFCITTEAVNICLRRVCNEQRDTGESTYKKSRSTLQTAFPFLLEVKVASPDTNQPCIAKYHSQMHQVDHYQPLSTTIDHYQPPCKSRKSDVNQQLNEVLESFHQTWSQAAANA